LWIISRWPFFTIVTSLVQHKLLYYKLITIVSMIQMVDTCVWWEYQNMPSSYKFAQESIATTTFYSITCNYLSVWKNLLRLFAFFIFLCNCYFIKQFKNSFACLILWSKHLEYWENTQEAHLVSYASLVFSQHPICFDQSIKYEKLFLNC